MKQVHIGYHSFTNSGIVEAVANVLYKDDFNVELFGVDLWADEIAEWEEKKLQEDLRS